MGPVLKEIKEAFEFYKRERFYSNGAHKDGINDTCERSPFCTDDHWMYFYIFPEGHELLNHKKSKTWLWEIWYPCYYCSEEQVLRIMAECGLL